MKFTAKYKVGDILIRESDKEIFTIVKIGKTHYTYKWIDGKGQAIIPFFDEELRLATKLERSLL